MKNNMNVWRYIDYVGDGISEYQCLKCKEMFQLTCNPGYWNIDKKTGKEKYITIYSYCLCCGTKWDGSLYKSMDDQSNNPRMLGERRLKFANVDYIVQAKLRKQIYPTWRLERFYTFYYSSGSCRTSEFYKTINGSAVFIYNYIKEYEKEYNNPEDLEGLNGPLILKATLSK